MKKQGKLYLIPTPIVDCDNPFLYMPLYNKEVITSIDYFVVEELRTARRFISKCKTGKTIDSLNFSELNEHTSQLEIDKLAQPLKDGFDVGVMSEAGVPGVADPGAMIVEKAHKIGVEVIPLVGPSSILMSLMASGMNGQSFTFNGYLPIKGAEKTKKLKELERKANQGQTQIFIEAPYRNENLFNDMLNILSPHTRLCVASNISADNQFIRTCAISEWKKSSKPSLKKIPTIFLIG